MSGVLNVQASFYQAEYGGIPTPVTSSNVRTDHDYFHGDSGCKYYTPMDTTNEVA